MSLIKLLTFKDLSDDRGGLAALEQGINIPFDIKRVYYLFKTKESTSRGFHAHKKLKQVVVCLSGSCRFVLDNGAVREEILLNDPLQGLYIDSFIWREMYDFSSNCILMVLASELFQEDDYIRDYQEFLNVFRE